MRGTAVIALTTVAVTLSCTSPSASVDRSAEIVIAGEFPIERNGGVGANDANGAVAIAVAEHPTVGGYRLRYEPLDDSLAGFPSHDKAVQNAALMVRESRILGAVGPWNSFNAMSVVPITGRADLVMVSPSTTADCLTARPKACLAGVSTASNFFRIAAPDSVGAGAEATLAIQKLGLTNFAVLTDGGSYGAAIGAAFSAGTIAAGGKVVMSRTYSPTEQDYAPLLRQTRDAGAQALFVGGSSGTGACRIRSFMSGVFRTPTYLFSGDGIVATDCLADAGSSADDHLVGLISARQPATVPGALRGLPRRTLNDAYVFAAYDCAEILVAAIDRAIKQSGGKIPTRAEVLAAVAATHDFKGLTGTFTFSPNGDAANPAVSLWYVRKGTWTFWQNA